MLEGKFLWRLGPFAQKVSGQFLGGLPSLDLGRFLGRSDDVFLGLGVTDSRKPERTGVRLVDRQASVNRQDFALKGVWAFLARHEN